MAGQSRGSRAGGQSNPASGCRPQRKSGHKTRRGRARAVRVTTPRTPLHVSRVHARPPAFRVDPPRSTALIASPSPDFKRRGQRAPTGPVTGGGARRPSPGLAHSLHLAAAGPVAAAWPLRNERAGSRPPATHAVAAAVAARGPDGTGPTCHWHALEEKSPFLRARKIGCALL